MYDRNILVEQTDPELWKAILAENARQEHHIELIASSNAFGKSATSSTPGVISISVTWVLPMTCMSAHAAMAVMAVLPFG